MYMALALEYPLFAFFDMYFQINNYDTNAVKMKGKAPNLLFQIGNDDRTLATKMHQAVLKTVAVMGVQIFATSLEDGLSKILAFAEEGDVGDIWVENVKSILTDLIVIYESSRDTQFKKDHDNKLYEYNNIEGTFNYLARWITEKFK